MEVYSRIRIDFPGRKVRTVQQDLCSEDGSAIRFRRVCVVDSGGIESLRLRGAILRAFVCTPINVAR
jgi:hypothetical protein